MRSVKWAKFLPTRCRSFGIRRPVGTSCWHSTQSYDRLLWRALPSNDQRLTYENEWEATLFGLRLA